VKTAVEWFVEELKKSLPSVYNNEFDEEINKAKEMESEYMIAFMQFIISQETLENTSSVSKETAKYYLEQFKNK